MGKNKIFILGVGVSNLNFNQALEEIRKWLENGPKTYQIFTPNPEILVLGQKDKELARILNSADLALPDGQGLIWASRFLKKSLKEKVAGSDLVEKLAELAAKEGVTIGLIGGGSGIALKALECLRLKYPNLGGFSIDGFQVGPRGEENNDTKRLRYYDTEGERQKTLTGKSVISLVSQYHRITVSPLILFVGLGAPKQEYFINQITNYQLPITNYPLVLMAVGGTFDYLSGKIPRAPKVIRLIGFEWFFRLLHQPWRIKRQLALLKFIGLVLKQKLASQDHLF